MKVVYYDILENLIKDIKKRITNKVELDSVKHELVIENQRVKYKEIDNRNFYSLYRQWIRSNNS